MSNLDRDKVLRMKREILEIIDESREVAYKVAFYSHPEVQAILNRLIDEWERNNHQGIPLDYASNTEIEVLYRVAKDISRKSPDELWALLVREYMRR